MKLFIVARNNEVIEEYKAEILKHGFEYGENNPDMILSLGGDGTFLVAERIFPGIPKLMVRDSDICNKCSIDSFDKLIDQIKDKNYNIIEYDKLETKFNENKLIAANDITIRNKYPQEAIRFQISIDDKPLDGLHIGDGIVVSTVWGSTGYFQAITGKDFKDGFGIALNNVKETKKDHYINTNEQVKVLIKRGHATLTSDNDRKVYTLFEGDSVIIKIHKEKVKIIEM